MMENGTGCSIVVRHNTEAFAKRCFVVPGGHSLVQIVDKYQVGIMQGPCFLHYTDTPVEIGGKAVLQVIRFYHCMSCKKSLMTYEHSLFETLPCQFFRSGKAAHVQEVAVLIYNRGSPYSTSGSSLPLIECTICCKVSSSWKLSPALRKQR